MNNLDAITITLNSGAKFGGLLDPETAHVLPLLFDDTCEAQEFALHCTEKGVDMMQTCDANLRALFSCWRYEMAAA